MKINCVKQHVSSQHQRRCAGTLHLSLSLARPLVCPAQADLMTVLSLRRFSGVCSPAEDEDTCPGPPSPSSGPARSAAPPQLGPSQQHFTHTLRSPSNPKTAQSKTKRHKAKTPWSAAIQPSSLALCQICGESCLRWSAPPHSLAPHALCAHPGVCPCGLQKRPAPAPPSRPRVVRKDVVCMCASF